MRPFSGHVSIYRIFDVGHEIDLWQAQKTSTTLSRADKFRFRRTIKSVVLEDVPLFVDLENINLEIAGELYPTTVTAKIWNFGAISINLRVAIRHEDSADRLLALAVDVQDSETIDRLAEENVQRMVQLLGPSIKKPSLWNQVEEYTAFVETSKSIDSDDIDTLLGSEYLYKLLTGEPKLTLSEQMKAPIRQSTIRYASNDLVALDWDSAYVISDDDAQDICDVIEFANVQLLELRYYDDLLDKKLNRLFRELISTEPSIFTGSYQRLSREASQIYLEAAEVVERIENSFKVVGDIYYAKVYRLALERFKLNDWKANVDQKLKNIIEISNVNSAEVGMKRSHLMELVIIILIAIEVIPFLYSLGLHQ